MAYSNLPRSVSTNVGVTSGGSLPQRWGGVYANAAGGLYQAQDGLLRRASIFTPQSPARFAFAEPGTGGEAFIPRRGDRDRSLAIADIAAGWCDARVVPGAPQLGGPYQWRGSGVTPAAGGTAATPGEFTATATIDLGEGIERVVDIKFQRHDRALRRRVAAGTGAAR